MKLLSFFFFLTLVGFSSAALAAPHSGAPPEKGEDASQRVDTENPEVMRNFSVTGTPAKGPVGEFIQRFNRRDYYHNYRQSLSPHIGALMALVDSTEDEDDLHYVLGVIWELPAALSPKWEIGLDWTTLSLGQITVARKHIYNEKGAFRPFYRYGITHKVVPDEQLASGSNFENYLLRAGVGFENIIRPPRSVRLDLDLAVGSEDVWVMFYYGYSWAW